MELSRIEDLTTKYLNAETSIKEEQELKEYYTSGEVAPHLQEYFPMFAFFAEQKEILYTKKEQPKKTNRRKGLYEWIAVAASICIVGGLFFFNNGNVQQETGTYEDPQLALQQTKDVLNMVSYYMNEGQEDLVYLKELGATTNKIIKTQ